MRGCARSALSTAWALLNHDTEYGPKPALIKRILASPNLPSAARRKIEEYVDEKIAGLYGHSKTGRDGVVTCLHPRRRNRRSLNVAGPKNAVPAGTRLNNFS